MNKDHIKQLWNECELDIIDFAKAIRAEALAEAKEHFSKQLIGFRASTREQALEEAAKVCEEYAVESMEAFNRTGHDFEDGQVNGGYGCAALIRGLK